MISFLRGLFVGTIKPPSPNNCIICEADFGIEGSDFARDVVKCPLCGLKWYSCYTCREPTTEDIGKVGKLFNENRFMCWKCYNFE